MIDVNKVMSVAERAIYIGAGKEQLFTADEIQSLSLMLREAEKDAARYRWLRDGVCMFYVSAEGCNCKDAYLTVTGYGDDDSIEVVDAAIDEQMKGNGDA